MININDMIEFMAKCKDSEDCFYMKVTVPGCPCAEMIVNPPENLASKSKYYMDAYGADGVHKHNDEIRIVDFGTFSFKK